MRRAFEKRSERYLENPDQLRLDFGDTPEAASAAEGLAEALAQAASAAAEIIVPEHTRRPHAPRKTRNEQLPAHLPRYEVPATVSDETKNCATHGEKTLIGHDRQETLEFERPKLKVRVTLIPKFACVKSPECGVTAAARPEGLVEGNRYDTSVAAEIIANKFSYHLPIYRQQDLFAGSGWAPSRSTLLNIAESAGDLLPPFIDYLRDAVLASAVLASAVVGTDDTRVTLLLPAGGTVPAVRDGDPKSKRIAEVFAAARAEKKPSVTARMWVYRSVAVLLNVFDFTVSRHRDGPDQFLIDSQFTGTLLADCYSGYHGLTLRSDARIARAACVSLHPSQAALTLASGLAASASMTCWLRRFKRLSPRSLPRSSSTIPSHISSLHACLADQSLPQALAQISCRGSVHRRWNCQSCV